MPNPHQPQTANNSRIFTSNVSLYNGILRNAKRRGITVILSVIAAAAPGTSRALSTDLCGAGRVLVNGQCANHAPSARELSQIAARYQTDFPAQAAWVWDPQTSNPCETHTYNDQAGQDATRRLNFYRWLVGAQPISHIPVTQGDLDCATIQRRNGLNHNPPPTAQCYTPAGAAAASVSNLSSASTPLLQLSSYMNENASQAFGHRRYLLGGNHNVSWANTGGAGCNHLYFNSGGAGPSTWYAWPPAGYAPSVVNTTYWHISSATAFPSGATVTIKNKDTNQTVSATEVVNLNTQYGYTDNKYALSFRPPPLTTPGVYQVTVSTSAGVSLYQYTVAFTNFTGSSSSSVSSSSSSSSNSSQSSSVPPIYHTIRGTLAGCGGQVQTTVGFCTSSCSGYICQQIPHGSSVRLTPYRDGYRFEPPYREYSSVTQDLTNQNFQGYYNRIRISGRIGTVGADMEILGSTTGYCYSSGTDYLCLEISRGENVTLRPRRPGYTFTPPSAYFPNIQLDAVVNFTATPVGSQSSSSQAQSSSSTSSNLSSLTSSTSRSSSSRSSSSISNSSQAWSPPLNSSSSSVKPHSSSSAVSMASSPSSVSSYLPPECNKLDLIPIKNHLLRNLSNLARLAWQRIRRPTTGNHLTLQSRLRNALASLDKMPSYAVQCPPEAKCREELLSPKLTPYKKAVTRITRLLVRHCAAKERAKRGACNPASLVIRVKKLLKEMDDTLSLFPISTAVCQLTQLTQVPPSLQAQGPLLLDQAAE